MRERLLRRLPVVEGGDRLVGVVGIGDVAVDRDERSALADISVAPLNRCQRGRSGVIMVRGGGRGAVAGVLAVLRLGACTAAASLALKPGTSTSGGTAREGLRTPGEGRNPADPVGAESE
jgi:hypothetical protein